MRTVFTAVAMATTVIASLSWVLYVYGIGLRRAAGNYKTRHCFLIVMFTGVILSLKRRADYMDDLLGFANTSYWGMAMGCPLAFLAMFVHPVIVDKIHSWIFRGVWTLIFVLLVAWQLCFSGAVLTLSSRDIDMARTNGVLVNNDLGLIFCGALGSIIFGGVSVGIYYARDLIQIKELK